MNVMLEGKNGAGTVADVTNHGTPEDDERTRYLKQEFSRRLREAREQRWPKPRQKDWAALMGLTDVRQYQRWEHGKQLPSLERLPKIVEVSGVDFSDLFEPEGGMTRDGLKGHFDERMDLMERKVEANFFALTEMMAELRSVIESRLPE